LRSSPAPCRRPRSCPALPREDAIGERERIEEKGYGREREERLRDEDKEERRKRVRKKERKNGMKYDGS
jgi:hypothetical protein